MKCIELFAGAGGAALGLEAAGIEHVAMCELDVHACATLRAAGLGPVIEGDVREVDWSEHEGKVDLVWSSFPCQAWSMASDRPGAHDPERNGWPWTMDAVDDIMPTWFLAENVMGLTFHKGECERDPRANPLDCPGCYFERVIIGGLKHRYDFVTWWKLDAADYGVPQRRRRIFIVAGPHPVKKPVPTHCDPRLGLLLATGMSPWKTMRDAINVDVDKPSIAVCATEYKGARHMGNASLDRTPMRASDQLWRATGRRRLEVDECATLQDFPSGHPFQGGKTSRYQQVGNAVPSTLARLVGEAVVSSRDKNA